MIGTARLYATRDGKAVRDPDFAAVLGVRGGIVDSRTVPVGEVSDYVVARCPFFGVLVVSRAYADAFGLFVYDSFRG